MIRMDVVTRLSSVRIALLASAATVLPLFVAAAVGDAPTGPVAEITRVERHLEEIFNGPAFVKDPAIALKYFETGPQVRLFDIMQPGEFRGEDFRKHFIEIGQQFQGKVEFTNLEVVADDHVGFASMTQHFAGKDKEGKPFDMTMRVTDCFHKTGPNWKIVHEHVSLPLDPATFMKLIKAKQ